MQKIIFFCDKCGKQIPDGDLKQALIDDAYDLCPDCHAALISFFQDWLSSHVKKKAVYTKKADIDMGKVHALRNAGWSNDKIGTEFGVSGQTIANHLRAEEAGHGED